MLPEGLLQEERISLDDRTSSKKKTLERLASLLTIEGRPPGSEQIYEKLLERERLGSTGMSHGIAIPHARIKGLRQPRGAFLRLDEPIDFDALDGQPVDLVFGLLVPEQATGEHLALLAELAQLFTNDQLCSRVRNARDAIEIRQLLNPSPLADAASDHG